MVRPENGNESLGQKSLWYVTKGAPAIERWCLQLSVEGYHSISGDETMQLYGSYYHTKR